jgi:HAE1 family hydrophobic/amphiphilic exporter-1
LVLGVFVAYMVLATQFNSFIHPFTVLLALPFSLTGAYVALYFSGNTLNLYSMIGLILLMGIVKKNSILLVDFTNELRLQGKDVRGALLEACPIRLRPILMTSVATVAAAIPEALSKGAGSETVVPMATAIVGGVTISTLLTLFVVPCAYEIFSRFEKRDYQAAEIDPSSV